MVHLYTWEGTLFPGQQPSGCYSWLSFPRSLNQDTAKHPYVVSSQGKSRNFGKRRNLNDQQTSEKTFNLINYQINQNINCTFLCFSSWPKKIIIIIYWWQDVRKTHWNTVGRKNINIYNLSTSHFQSMNQELQNVLSLFLYFQKTILK